MGQDNYVFFPVVFDMVGEAILATDTEGCIIAVNACAERIFGYASGELRGLNIKALMTDDIAAVHDRYMATSNMSNTIRAVCIGRELMARRKDGSPFPIELTLGRGNDGDRIVYTAVMRDISERQRKLRELDEARRQAERANQAKTVFLSHITHELRTPLNSVLGFSQLLGQQHHGELNDEQRLCVDQIRGSGSYLLQLIDQVLDLTKLDLTGSNLRLTRINPAALVEETVAMVEWKARTSGVTVNFRAPLAQSMMHADPLRTKQVIYNLLSNAIKYNRQGGSVWIGIEETPRHTRIIVQDNGLGISEDKRSQLFTLFDRLGAEKSSIEGAGVGLALAQRLVKAMHGDIGYEPAPNGGSRFWFRLPRLAPEDQRRTRCETET